MSGRLPPTPVVRNVARASCLVASGAITRERACESKQRYERQKDAKAAAKSLAKDIGRPVTTYHCAFCGGHHLTKVRHGEDAA